MAKKFLLLGFFLLAGIVSFSQYSVQSKYFVYLQTEPAQPFYIKINGQVISANSSGYLILPQLKDGDYKLIVGFPENKNPEMGFNFKIDSKDKGYLIKDFGTDGWALFDLQTMAVQKPLSANEMLATATPKPQQQVQTQPQAQPQSQPAENVSDFTKVLSKAANDPSLLEKPKPQAQEEKPVVQQPIAEEKPAVQPQSQPIAKPQPESQEVKSVIQQPVVENKSVTQPQPQPPLVAQAQPQPKVQEGVVVVYEDVNETGVAEPVSIFIPNPTTVEPQPVPQIAEQPQATAPQVVENKQNVVEEEKPVQPVVVTPVVRNNACTVVADENDFLKLRKLMAQQDNDEQMVIEAQRAFKSKCYTTAQIKYLSSMFFSNTGKYQLFEAAYKHVSDPENFGGLQSQLKDQNFIDKFNSLIAQ